MFLLVAFSLFIASAFSQSLGLCGEDLPVGTCGDSEAVRTIDIRLNDLTFGAYGNEFWAGENFEITDALAVSAIEVSLQSGRNRACTGDCADISKLDAHPSSCVNGYIETRLVTFDSEPSRPRNGQWGVESEFEGTVASILYLGDKSFSFDHGNDGSFLRLGGETNKKWGRITMRFVKTTADDEPFNFRVQVRLHLVCPNKASTMGTYAGLLTYVGLERPLIPNFAAPQPRGGRMTVQQVNQFLEIQKVEEVTLHAVTIYAREFITGGSVELVRDGVRMTIAKWKTDIASGPSFGAEQLEQPVTLQKGDLLQWSCNFDTTKVPKLPWARQATSGPISPGATYLTYSCVMSAVYTNSRCGSTVLFPKAAVADCPDPLFKTEEPEENPEESIFYVYDYDPNHGVCSDGKEWTDHPYRCTDQFGGGVCAYCTGRANDREVKTCMNRDGKTCNEIFDSWERKTWCNMEFECPASTVTISFFAAISAFFLAMLF